jgi:hypothetical protein
MGFGTFFSYWRGQANAFRAYWLVYGGGGSFIRSPYLHVSVILASVCSYFVDLNAVKVSDIAISAIPNLLGFTLGAMAIALAFSSAQLFKQLTEDGKSDSFFLKLMANLVHFILCQVAALIAGIVAKTTGKVAIEYVTLVLLLYAILVTLATGIQLFQAAAIYNASASLPHDNDRGHGSES